MDEDRILKALDACERVTNQYGAPIPRRAPTDLTYLSNGAKLEHLAWMVKSAREFISFGRTGKAFRWLGFVQGALWALDISSIVDLKNMNKPTGEDT